MKKTFKMGLFVLLFLFIVLIGYFFIGGPKEAKEIVFGVNFSQKHASNLGLNWKNVYLALINDLGAKKIKIATYWDLIEPEEGEYYFQDLDWQVEEAEKKNVKLLLVIGMKTPRWPECHIPYWAKNKEVQQKKILKLLKEIVLRYKNKKVIWAWQVENEPFFPFGECPWSDKKFLQKEINLVKTLDPQRPIIVSDTGEWSFWFRAAKLGDLVGITMYREVWVENRGFYLRYIFPPVFYWRRYLLVKKLFAKEVICVELQAEPWGPTLLYNLPLEEQKKTMNLERFKENINYAKKTGLKEFYLWGTEWWYWLKEKQGDPGIWQEAKKLF